ncbi:ATPase, P-type (transporting), HAD superfamily, subfamily IC/heavy metal translocating P-type ATPase [Eubacterium ruminantium]|nr:ATPase, P-type (transporting), HAD superfamily, subfamily IC/heavy metal translocating P-type ATPase [Eubacterium ruminantium]
MKCKILHESKNRMRVHLFRKYMTCGEADKVEYFLLGLPYVSNVKVRERTSDATIIYDSGKRQELIKELSEFSLKDTEVAVPDHTARELTHNYQDRMFYLVARRVVTRAVFPVSIRNIITAVKAVPYILEGLRSLARRKLTVSVLDASSITVSMLRRDADTAGNVIFLLGVGDLMDEWTRKKSVADLASAMALNIDKVWKVDVNGEEKLVDINRIRPEDTIIVRTGNMIPLDGLVADGVAEINQASITGESLPVHKEPGGYVYAGTVLEEGEIRITVKKNVGSGQYDRIARMIEESEKLKSAAEENAFRMADKLVPYTFGATALTYLLTRNATRATSILMVDFCCALKLSIPIAVLSAMREASQHHISVKGGKFLEKIAEADTIVFDKTGTLTYACPTVKDLITFDGSDKNEMLRLAACLEEHYPHSVANAVVKAAEEKGLVHEEKHSRVEYVVAHGIASSIDGEKVVIGSYHFVFEDEGCVISDEEREKFENLSDAYSHLYMAIGGRVKAAIMIDDPVKKEAKEVVKKLQALGLKVVMLTGDSSRVAKRVARELEVDEVKAQVLPEDKAAFIEEEHAAGRTCIMIGDGVNDSPALSVADAGIAINSGAAIAREVADIMISEDNLNSLVILRQLGTELKKRMKGNYQKIVGFNAGLILLGATGILQPTMTALLHNGSTIVISMRSMTDLLEQ